MGRFRSLLSTHKKRRVSAGRIHVETIKHLFYVTGECNVVFAETGQDSHESLTGMDLVEGFCVRIRCKRQQYNQRQVSLDWVSLDGKCRSEAGTKFYQGDL